MPRIARNEQASDMPAKRVDKDKLDAAKERFQRRQQQRQQERA